MVYNMTDFKDYITEGEPKPETKTGEGEPLKPAKTNNAGRSKKKVKGRQTLPRFAKFKKGK